MTLRSCIYEGQVRHRRFAPVKREFRYPLFLMYVDLEELPTLFDGRWFWSASRLAPVCFRRGDHLGSPDQPLDEAVGDLVRTRTGHRPTGPIRLLTHFRSFGFAMNPISLYYCWSMAGTVDFVVAEVNNTPWNEQTCYVLDLRRSTQRKDKLACEVSKDLHVSPFLSMDFAYRFRLNVPGPLLVVHIENLCQPPSLARPVFDATLMMRRRPLNRIELARVLCRYPFMTGQVFARIYWQAFRLWWQRVPYIPHPSKAQATHEYRV
ncbi:MAG TPA: DUF1365 domain-containing protein [Pirellulales bacterium]|nr:DUF1365 domain-containing protein [Pirellulales bacterium]